MSCCHPYSAFETGRLTDNGKKEMILEKSTCDFLSLSSAERRGFSPLPSKLCFLNGVPGLKDPVPIPCGCCIGCRADRARDWTTRIILESRQHPFNYFVTLTYSDSSLPLSNGVPVLVKKDLQNFMKRFRKALGIAKVRFFACGEYGDATHRPHYHLILFMDEALKLQRFGKNRYHSQMLSASWPFGLHEVSHAEPGCFAYVAGYCVKKLKSDLESFPQAPFILMSRRPGIGALGFSASEYQDLKVYLEKGKVAFLPRFLRSKLPFYESMKEDLARSAKDAQAIEMELGDFSYPYFLGESRRIKFLQKLKERNVL